MEGYTLITKPHSSQVLTFFLTTLLVITIFMTSSVSAATTSNTPSKANASLKFIKISCNTTTYPLLCYKSLYPYTSSIKTNSLKLCYTALTIAIKAARDTSAVVSKLATQKGITKIEAGAIKDCIENIRDTVDELKQSVKAMSSLSGPDKAFQMDNAKTYASAAITDESSCLDGFSGRKVNPVVKKKIRTSIQNVEQLTSNALSLINHLKY